MLALPSSWRKVHTKLDLSKPEGEVILTFFPSKEIYYFLCRCLASTHCKGLGSGFFWQSKSLLKHQNQWGQTLQKYNFLTQISLKSNMKFSVKTWKKMALPVCQFPYQFLLEKFVFRKQMSPTKKVKQLPPEGLSLFCCSSFTSREKVNN